MAISVQMLVVRAACAAAAMAVPLVSAQTRPASVSEVNIPLRDARTAGANSVRFAAAQNTNAAPVVAIFGVTKANWPKLLAAMQRAVADGFPVEGVIIGPDSAGPALEIYVKGHHVTRPINPNAISGPELTKLIRDIHREHYGR